MVAIAKHPKKLLNKDKTIIVKGRNVNDGEEHKAGGKLQEKVKFSGIKKGVKKASKKEKKKIVNAFKLTEALGDKTCFVKNPVNTTTTVLSSENSEKEPREFKQKNEDRKRKRKHPVTQVWKPVYRGEINLPSNLKTQVHQAVSALLQLEPENKKELLGGAEKPIFVQLSSIKVPLTPTRYIRFELPHPLRTFSSDVCLFVSDLVKGKKHDHEPTVEHVRQLLRDKNVTVLINEIIPLRQLKVEYDQYELKRSLCHRYDFFLSEAKISGHISHCLGREFHKRSKFPVPVNLQARDLDKEISRALSKVALKVHSKGRSYIVKVAHTGQTPEEIETNVLASAENIARLFPGGWDNIQSLMVKTPTSLAVPVYMTLKSPHDVSIPVVKPVRAKAAVPVTGELSTIPGAKVTVFPSGEVLIDGVEESDEEWKNPYVRKLVKKHKWRRKRLQRQIKSANAEGDEDNKDDIDIDIDSDEDEDFSDKEEYEDEEEVQKHQLKEIEPVKEKKKKAKKGKKSEQARNEAPRRSEDMSPSGVKKDHVSLSKKAGEADSEDDDNDALGAQEAAYLSSWVHLKDVEEKESEKKAKAEKSKTKPKGKVQAKNVKKPFKNKEQAKGSGKIQKKAVKKKTKKHL